MSSHSPGEKTHALGVGFKTNIGVQTECEQEEGEAVLWVQQEAASIPQGWGGVIRSGSSVLHKAAGPTCMYVSLHVASGEQAVSVFFFFF